MLGRETVKLMLAVTATNNSTSVFQFYTLELITCHPILPLMLLSVACADCKCNHIEAPASSDIRG